MKWISVKNRLPDYKTRYAGKYGVSVICYDGHEEPEYANPSTCSFRFKEQQFQAYCTGPRGGIWEPISVTHWMPMPESPKD
jgi:hypothetical protein